MHRRDFYLKQNAKMIKLLLGPKPTTQLEKDIFNLKYARYSIACYSPDYRLGLIATLDRTIKMLERQKKEGEK